MNATVFGLCGAMAAGLGLYGLITDAQPLRKILGFNLLGAGGECQQQPRNRNDD